MDKTTPEGLVEQGLDAAACPQCQVYYDHHMHGALLVNCVNKHTACCQCVKGDPTRCPICLATVAAPATELPQLGVLASAIRAIIEERNASRAAFRDCLADMMEAREQRDTAYDECDAVKRDAQEWRELFTEEYAKTKALKSQIKSFTGGDDETSEDETSEDETSEEDDESDKSTCDDSAVTGGMTDSSAEGSVDFESDESSAVAGTPLRRGVFDAVLGNICLRSTGQTKGQRRRGELSTTSAFFYFKTPKFRITFKIDWAWMSSVERDGAKVQVTLDALRVPHDKDWLKASLEFPDAAKAEQFIAILQSYSGCPVTEIN